jgi:hypothetical protein
MDPDGATAIFCALPSPPSSVSNKVRLLLDLVRGQQNCGRHFLVSRTRHTPFSAQEIQDRTGRFVPNLSPAHRKAPKRRDLTRYNRIFCMSRWLFEFSFSLGLMPSPSLSCSGCTVCQHPARSWLVPESTSLLTVTLELLAVEWWTLERGGCQDHSVPSEEVITIFWCSGYPFLQFHRFCVRPRSVMTF